MSFQEYLAALRRKSTEIRIEVLKMITRAQSGSVGAAMSSVEILAALYYGQTASGPILNIDPANPNDSDQDYFILSKISAAPTWYAILADLGYFPTEELDYFRNTGALLSVVPRSRIPGVSLTAGLSGYGVACAVGLALSLKAERLRNRVFVLAGDAEMSCGTVWESVLHAGHNKLWNFVLLVDRNGIQQDGIVRNLNIADPLSDKLTAFGFRTINVFAGHDFDHLLDAMEKAISETRLPVAIIVKTVKGKGVDFAENKSFYHDKPLSSEELEEAISKGFVPEGMQNNYMDGMTRLDYCRMAVRFTEYALDMGIDAVLEEKGVFRDPNAFRDTADPDIMAAFALGITSGTGNFQFSPNSLIDRQQAAKMLMNVCSVVGLDLKHSAADELKDIGSAEYWAVDAISFVCANGFMEVDSNDNFCPADNVSRQQGIIAFNRIGD